MAALEVEISSGARYRISLSSDADPDAELRRFVAGEAPYRGSSGWLQTDTGAWIKVGEIVSVRAEHGDHHPLFAQV